MSRPDPGPVLRNNAYGIISLALGLLGLWLISDRGDAIESIVVSGLGLVVGFMGLRRRGHEGSRLLSVAGVALCGILLALTLLERTDAI